MNECDDDCEICYGYLTDGSGDELSVDDAVVPLGEEE
jgi:meiotically up-regulated gene 157 (Mug157) protein